MNAEAFRDLLRETNYDQEETDWLYDSFKNGFDIGYRGDMDAKITSQNLKLTEIGDETDLWNKVMKEVKLKRYAGPFRDHPI